MFQIQFYLSRRLSTALVAFVALISINAAASGLDSARGIIGIMPLPEVFGRGPCDRYEPKEILLYPKAGSSEIIGRIYVAKPWRFPPTGGCEGLEVVVSIVKPRPKRLELPMLEFSYEQLGAIVLEKQGRWFKIKHSGGQAWMNSVKESRFLSIERLLKESLAYLRKNMRRPLLQSPNNGSEALTEKNIIKKAHPVEVLEVAEIEKKLWLRVKMLDKDPCTNEQSDISLSEGWVPFHDENGVPVVWYHSRGC